MSDIRLVVQADDLGMCRAVNEGIRLGFTDGVLTQTSVMAPTPWFAEGAAMAKRLGATTGLHVTLTCEWEYLRWGPLTAAPSLRDTDGLFKRTVKGAAQGSPDEAVAEAHAQIDRAESLGLELSYVDPHMGVSVPPAYQAACKRLGVKFIYDLIEPHHDWSTSVTWLSLMSRTDRAAHLVEYLEQVGPGTHLVLSHPSVASDEIRAVTPADAENYFWAESTRVADLEALCAPEVRKVIERRNIDLVSVRNL